MSTEQKTCRYCRNLGVAWSSIPVCLKDHMPVKLESTCDEWQIYERVRAGSISASLPSDVSRKVNDT